MTGNIKRWAAAITLAGRDRRVESGRRHPDLPGPERVRAVQRGVA